MATCAMRARRMGLKQLPPAYSFASSRALPSRRLASSLPHVGQVSFWRSLIPKPLRSGQELADPKPKSRGWNPATFFLLIFLVIGSNAIQMISLKRDFATFTRQSDVRIGLLREVVEKLQQGEQVDVEKMLGTGDPQREQEWEDVLREIEREDITRPSKKQEKAKQADKPATVKTSGPESAPSPKSRAQFF